MDNRIRILIENGVTERQRSLFVVVGDRGKDQVRHGKCFLTYCPQHVTGPLGFQHIMTVGLFDWFSLSKCLVGTFLCFPEVINTLYLKLLADKLTVFDA